ncbi:hypothetical protein UA38_00610 [Photobacterium kishitanii]|uniref:Uncharacterized protein n=1 Tax=Photobacterium kishitanii TaxID=318456 RepID=A0AAX0YZ84_9GAMM|nr:hypothetical protein [Photobacterium kishitanii]KJG10699.1 hypothetical protein UB40_04870 [Photobacterium kishitanii]KJG59712.1 hypothetical protein UA38_00610 [Photobacterium kishitanii]KJG63000.1 hypothetical protein UA42_00965 [Photobacterium kishitanii]KJG67989.1 hypothetical protein UA40_01870 [Photobacterium kishitanii]KJG71175.1 hypothetical protein UA41_00620 [Photobacterium kishitanii]
MKAYLLRVNDRKRRIAAAVIAMLLIAASLVTTGLISALCDLSAFVILLVVLWLKMSERQLKNSCYEVLTPSVKVEIEP